MFETQGPMHVCTEVISEGYSFRQAQTFISRLQIAFFPSLHLSPVTVQGRLG
jgi:hypothetical protein